MAPIGPTNREQGLARTLELYGKIENVFDVSYTGNGFYAPGVWSIGGMRLVF
jgi:hypothetical protein